MVGTYDSLAHVDVTSDGSGADVEPIDVLGRELVGVCESCQASTVTEDPMYVRDVLTVSTQPVDKIGS